MQPTTQTRHLVPYLHLNEKDSTSMADLKAKGFQVKEGYTSQWSEDEKKAVSTFLLEFLKDPEGYYDVFLWISRKVLHNSKSRNEVKKYLTGKLSVQK